MSGVRWTLRPRSMLRFVRIRKSHARRFVPGWNDRQLRKARAYVSWTRSSASSREPTSRRATPYTWSDRSRAPVASCRAALSEVSLTRSTVAACSVNNDASHRAIPGRPRGMNGYEFITAVDDKRWGTVVDRRQGYVIVEHGTLRKHCYAVPESAVEVDEEAKQVRTTLSGDLIGESPRVESDFDEQAVARHYGLSGMQDAPPTEGYGATTADDPAQGAEYREQVSGLDTAVEQRAKAREGTAEATDAMPDESPALLGDRLSDVRDDER